MCVLFDRFRLRAGCVPGSTPGGGVFAAEQLPAAAGREECATLRCPAGGHRSNAAGSPLYPHCT